MGDKDSERRLQIQEAVRLYEAGRISSGRAAELVGMERMEFLLTLERYEVFPFESELRDLEDRAARDRQKVPSPITPWKGTS